MIQTRFLLFLLAAGICVSNAANASVLMYGTAIRDTAGSERTTDLHLIDVASATSLGSREILIEGSTRDQFDGLAISPTGELYAFSASQKLYSINRSNAVATLIGSVGKYVEGADFNGQTLIASTFSNNQGLGEPPTLFSVSTIDAATTDIITATSPVTSVRSLATADANTMLLRTDNAPAGLGTNKLRAVDLTSGTNVLRGDLGFGTALAAGMDFASDGNLYGLNFDGSIIRINPLDGSVTPIGSTSFQWISATSAPSDAVAPGGGGGVVPEPNTYLVFIGLAFCFGAASWWRRRRGA